MYTTSQHRSTAQTTTTADPTFGVTVALAVAPLAIFVALSYAAFTAVFVVGVLTTLAVSFVRRRLSETARRRETAFDRATRA
ncbi:MFS transporter [Haloprofundus sp. MHR1]|uniref:MFS transporter n=1 Tax=Haloprofundus sp. MHR1 TaxID=2572921 RepID=UPI0010BEDF79|nr:MFS transporter [Haloprofundus sp. MHR1]QCJ45627.1 MFS transporter [Haloprofundus sp. MHR1]